MKTPYEHRAKYGFDRLLFGKPSKRARLMYWLLLGLLLLINIAYVLKV